MKTVLILANPTSGGYRPEMLEEVLQRLRDGGATAELHLTSHAGEIGELCSNPDLSLNTVVIAGGDGSVNEALTGLRDHPNPPKLAVIPSGTANVLALEYGLPRRPKALADMILRGRTDRLHFGIANGHPFLLMASAGFDAEVVHSLPLAFKRRFGKLAYVVTALKVALKRKGVPLVVLLDGATYKAKLAVATNARHYGGPFVLCPDASTCLPGLYMLLLERDDPWSTFQQGIALMLGRLHKARGTRLIAFTEASITSERPVAAQIDGDPFGTTPLQITSSADSLAFVIP